MQTDELTDITNKAILLVYIHYEDNCELKEEMCSNELSSHSIGVAVFEAFNQYVTAHRLNRTNCVGICTDGVAAITGIHYGLVTRIKAIFPKCRFIHCLIHREIKKKKSSEFNNVLSETQNCQFCKI